MLSDVAEFLSDSISIERATVSGFDQTTTWSVIAIVEGYLWALSGGESIDYGGDNVRSTHRAVMSVTDVTEADRLTLDGKVYQIRYVDTKSLDGESWLQIDAEYIGAAQ
jgi:head-tail adaptor